VQPIINLIAVTLSLLEVEIKLTGTAGNLNATVAAKSQKTVTGELDRSG
jgi:hypothetical protein